MIENKETFKLISSDDVRKILKDILIPYLGCSDPTRNLNDIYNELIDKINTLTVNSGAVDIRTEMIAGKGLTGGGDLSTNRTFNINSISEAIIVNDDSLDLSIVDDLGSDINTKPLSAAQGFILNRDKASNLIQITAGDGLTGGGDLKNNIIFSIESLTDGIVIYGDSIGLNTVNELDSTSITKPLSANMGKYLYDNKANNSIVIIAGNGLSGGGNLTNNEIILNITSASPGILVHEDVIELRPATTLDIGGVAIGPDFELNQYNQLKLIPDFYNSMNNRMMEKTMVYYGYPLAINGAYDLNKAMDIYKEYDNIVFGAEYHNPSHEAYPELVAVLSEIHSKYPNIKTFGYVPIGKVGGGNNYDMATIKSIIDQWSALNVTGIFLDEFGYDYSLTRDWQNEIITYCRTKNKIVFVNSCNMAYVFSNENIIIDWLANFNGNPNNLPCLLTENDYTLFENNTWKIDGTQADAWDTYRLYDYFSESSVEYGMTYYDRYKTKAIVLDAILKEDENTQTSISKMTLSIMVSKINRAHGIAFGNEFWGSDASFKTWDFPSLDLYENIGDEHSAVVDFLNDVPKTYSAIINGHNCVANILPNSSLIDGKKLTNPWKTANEIASISVIAGNGLTGGGSLNSTSNLTIHVATANDGLIINADNVQLDTQNNLTSTSITKPLSANMGKYLYDNKASNAVVITAGNGLTGGGDLTNNRIIDVISATNAIVINPENIEYVPETNITSTSETKSLSAKKSNDIMNNLAGGAVNAYIEDATLHTVGSVWLSSNNIGLFICLEENLDDYIDADKWGQIDSINNYGKLQLSNEYSFTYKGITFSFIKYGIIVFFKVKGIISTDTISPGELVGTIPTYLFPSFVNNNSIELFYRVWKNYTWALVIDSDGSVHSWTADTNSGLEINFPTGNSLYCESCYLASDFGIV